MTLSSLYGILIRRFSLYSNAAQPFKHKRRGSAAFLQVAMNVTLFQGRYSDATMM